MGETQINRTAKQVGNSAQDAGSAAARAVEDTIPTFTEAARATADALRVAGRKASAVMADFGEDAVDRSKRTRDQVSTRVQAQPLTALLVAAGVGLLAGMLLTRD